MGGKKGKKKSKKKKSYTKAQKMAKARIAAKKTAPKATKTKSTPASTGRAPSKTPTKAQNLAKARIAAGKTISQVKAANKQSMKDAASDRNKKFKQTKVQTFGGKKTSFTPKEQTRIKDAGYKVEGYGQAKFKPTPKPTPKVDPIDRTKIAGNYTSPNVTGYGLRPDGVTGEYKTGDIFNTGGISGKDYRFDGKQFVPFNKTAMLGGDNLGSKLGIAIGSGIVGGALGIKNKVQEAAENLRRINEKKMEGLGDQSSIYSGPGTLISASNLTGLAPKSTRFESATGSDAFAKSLGINTDVGGVNYGGLGSIREGGEGGGSTSRAIGPVADGGQYARNVIQARFPGASPNSSIFGMNAAQLNQPGGPFAQPGPTPENTPESDYTSYQPGSFYNQSDTNMNPTNFLRSTRNVLTTPARMLGINNRFTNMLIPKSNEAIQDARDQRGPRPTLTRRRGGGGGARLPVAPLTPEEILLPEQMAAAQEAPVYQQAAGQTGVDPNRLLQIQQQAYQQAFNPYNPMTVGGFNPFFRFFDRRGGQRRGAFRRAFRRD